eukprot:gene7236-14765_t
MASISYLLVLLIAVFLFLDLINSYTWNLTSSMNTNFNFTQHLTLADLEKLQYKLSEKYKQIILQYCPIHFQKDVLETFFSFEIPQEFHNYYHQRNNSNNNYNHNNKRNNYPGVIYRTECTSSNSLGNVLSLYMEIRLCADVSEVAIHYRCGDNLNHGGYGLLPFSAFLNLVPISSKLIYILSESKHRDSNSFCQHILDSLYDTMIKHFPTAIVALIRGDNIIVDMMRLASANITICS